MTINIEPAKWKILLAFAIIYFISGSTFFAIRVGVHEIPPLILAAMRFLMAGSILVAWALAHGDTAPKRGEWLSTVLLAILIFVVSYGSVFWAEQRVPSGVAAVIVATTPVFTALLDTVWLRRQRLTGRLLIGLLAGLLGVTALVRPSMPLGGSPIYVLGVAGLIIASFSWSLGSVLMGKLELPKSKIMSAGTQMLVGGIFLGVIAMALDELPQFHPFAVSVRAWFALLYLVVAGSIIAYTAYVWLLHYRSPTKVSTFTYVNPVVAIAIGSTLGGETLDLRVVLGTLFVLSGVVLITRD